jgi:hypothetical protein
MPTRKEIDAVQSRIEALTTQRFWAQGEFLRPVAGDAPEAGTPWLELSFEDRREAIYVNTDWKGFSLEEQMAITDMVAEGESHSFWEAALGGSLLETQPGISLQALDSIEDDIDMLKAEPEIHLESTRRFVMPDLEDAGSVYDTCDVLGPWDTLNGSDRLRALQELDWTNVPPHDALRIIDREVDLSQITEPSQKQWISAIQSRDHGDRQADEDPLPAELASLAAEIRSDEHAARVRDYGEADAATYDQRVADGAATVKHVAPVPEPADPAALNRSVTEMESGWVSPQEQFKNILSSQTTSNSVSRQETTDRTLSRSEEKDRER